MIYLNANNTKLWGATKHYRTIWRSKATFYEILKVEKNCSSEDIRKSYLKLSKLYHPDKIKDSKAAHQNFVEINEAYSTLSKPNLRNQYDYMLTHLHSSYNYQEYEPGVPPNPIFHRWRKACDPSEEECYYGIKGIKRKSNSIVLLFCILTAVLGVSVQILLIRNSFTFKRNKMKKESELNQEILGIIKDRSKHMGNEYQIELLRQKMEENEMKKRI